MNRREILTLGTASLCFQNDASLAGGAAARRLFNVQTYGARGDGRTKDTGAIQRAIDVAFQSGGGTVFLGPGDYLSGGIVLKSNVTLCLAAGATLLGSKDLSDYTPQAGPSPHGDANVHHLIFARDAVNVGLCGTGRVDGQGRAFWVPSSHVQVPENFWQESISNSYRPLAGNARPSPMLEFVGCKNLRIEGVTLANSAGWTLRPIDCESVFIRGIRVRNPVYGPNTDGMDVTCCRNVLISDCDIATGDDALCIKSEGPYGGQPAPTKNIIITNCVLTGCCNGFKMGTATRGAFENITFTNSVIYNEEVPLNARIIAGVAVEMVDGGSVEGIVISNIRMQNTRTPIFVRLGNRSGNPPEGPKPGSLRGVMIDDIYATGAILTSSVTGLPGHDVEDVALRDIRIDTVEGGDLAWVTRPVPELPASYPEARMFGRLPAYGLYCRHVSGLRLENVHIEARKPDSRPLMLCEDVKNVKVVGLSGDAPASSEPLLLFRNVRRALVQGCWAPPHLDTFVRAEGNLTSDISLVGNDLSRAAKSSEAGEDASRSVIVEAGNLEPSK